MVKAHPKGPPLYTPFLSIRNIRIIRNQGKTNTYILEVKVRNLMDKIVFKITTTSLEVSNDIFG